MNMPRLEINQTFAKIDWDVQSPRYSFEPGQAKVLIEQTPAEMNVQYVPPRLTIDQSECWADMDIKHIFRRNEEAAVDAKRQVLNYIEKTVLEGAQLGAIENGGNVIRNLAMGHHLLPQHSFQYGNVPRNFSLRIECIPGEMRMDWKIGGTTINVQDRPFQHNYERGRISYTLQKKNELHFESIGGNLNIEY